MRKIRTGILVCIAALLFVLGSAYGELASNLKVKTEYNPKNRKLVAAKTYVDDSGQAVVASDKGYATIRYSYTSYNLVSMIELLDAEGKLVTGSEGYAVCKKVYTDRRLAEQSYWDEAGKPAIGPEGYHKQVTKYKNLKHLTTWRYDTEGKAVGTHQITEYVRVGKYDRVSSDSWYDADNQLTAGPNGYARVEYDWSGKQKTRIAYFGADGKPWYSTRDHYATMKSVYKGGKIRETRYYDAAGEAIPGPQGYAYVLYTYPADGSRLAMYYNADGSTYYLANGTCGVRRKLGARNRETERIFYIGEGQKGNSKDGYTRIAISYTKTGQVSKQKYYDEKNKPVVVPSLGYAEMTNIYENGKRLIWTVYTDEKGKPAACKEGYEAVKRIYTDKILTGIKYYRGDKKTPMVCNAGYASLTYENDENKKPLVTRFFDADGKPCLNDQNADEVRNTWAVGLKTSESYWADGEPVAGKNGWHRAEYEYNSKGSVMCTRFYDEDGELMTTPGQEYAYVRTVLFQDRDLVGTEAGEAISPADDDGTDAGEDTEGEDEDEREETETGSPDNGTITEYYGLDEKLMNLKAGYAYIVREMNAAGKVTRETYFDRDGQETDLAAGYSRIDREYDEYGNLSRESYFDRAGNRVTLDQGFHCMVRENDLNGNPLSMAWYDADGDAVVHTGNKYHRIDRTWLDGSHALTEAYFDAAGQPTAPNDTFVRIEREFDKNKNTVAEQYYGADGKLTVRNAGYDEMRREFDEKNRVTRISYYIAGEPAANTDGIASLTRAYDEFSCIAAEAYFGPDGEPTASVSKKYHRLERTWQDSKHMISEAWFDVSGEPATAGDTYVRIEREYDDRGNMTAEKTKGADGKPIARKAGYDETRQEFDGENRVTRISYWLDGAPFGLNDAAVIERSYDAQGCVTDETYYGVNGEPVIHTGNKYHRVRRIWADPKHVSRESWFDTKGKPVAPNDTFVRIDREFDIQGNTVREVTYGEDGTPIARKAGYDEIRQEFNRKNQVIRISYFLNGEPVLTVGAGCASLTRTYDDKGLVASEAYFGTAGEAVGHKSAKYHRIDRTWLDKNHVTSEAWFDTEDQPMLMNGDRYVKIVREYDERKNLTDEKTLDAAGNLTARNDGYDENRREYNDKNQMTRISYFLNGEPVLTAGTGCASLTRTYDDKGLVASEAYFGTAGEAVGHKSAKYHRIDRTWLDKNHVTSEAWFDTEDQPMLMNGDRYVKIVREYDERKNLTDEKTLDAAGNLTARNDGYDENRREYNDKNQMIRISYFLNGEPVLTVGAGCASLTRTYDDKGLVASEAYFGTAGEAVGHKSAKYHRIDRTWLDKNHVTSEAWFDTEDRPMANENGVYRTTYEYNGAGKVIQEQYFGADGELMENKDGVARVIRTYGEDGSLVEEKRLNLEGE